MLQKSPNKTKKHSGCLTEVLSRDRSPSLRSVLFLNCFQGCKEMGFLSLEVLHPLTWSFSQDLDVIFPNYCSIKLILWVQFCLYRKDMKTQTPVCQTESIFRERFCFVFIYLTKVIKNGVIRVGPNPIWPVCLLLCKGETWTQRQQEQKGGYMKPEEVRKSFRMVAVAPIARHSNASVVLSYPVRSTFWLLLQSPKGYICQVKSSFQQCCFLYLYLSPLFFPLKPYPVFCFVFGLFVTWFLIACGVFELLISLPFPPSARITGISHQARKKLLFFKGKWQGK